MTDTQNPRSAHDPLEQLLVDPDSGDLTDTLGWNRELPRPSETKLLGLLAAAENWTVIEGADAWIVATEVGDPIASLPKDEYGRSHAYLMALAPLLARRVLDRGLLHA
jgi:hypothetical protein